MRKVSGMRRKNGATDDASGGNTKAGHLSGKGTWVGTSVRRREDPRLLTGRGRYIDDLTAPGMLHAQFVRSTEAYARVVSVDLSEVREIPGVVAAFTAADLDLGDLICRMDRPESEFRTTAMPVLARDIVRFVGEPVAIVLATDPYAVEDGLEAAVSSTNRYLRSSPRKLRWHPMPRCCIPKRPITPLSTSPCSRPRASTMSSLPRIP